ncbi:TNF receptor-associated factor family protein [Exaiptasia diaphana]|nr:TNF receptor-associated factor family protein [Exaiptasia diaphana]
MDRRRLNDLSLRPVLSLSGFIGNLLIRCSTNEENALAEGRPQCEWTGAVGTLTNHIRDQCQFVLVLCPIDNCNTRVRRQNLVEHQAQCPHRLVPCQNCQDLLQFADMTMHLRHECPSADLACPYRCGATMERRRMNFHMATTCQRRMVLCEVHNCGHWCRASHLREHMLQRGVEHTQLMRRNAIGIGHVDGPPP